MSYISGNITFCDNSVNLSTSTGQINGTACFLGSSSNCGPVCCASFFSTSSNCCTVYIADFNDTAVNNSIIVEQVAFCGSSCNNCCVCGSASFYGNSINSLTASLDGEVIFSGNSVNCGTIAGTACFYGTSLNSGIVEIAIFNDGASNLGTISGSGLFYGEAVNSGVVSGNAIFADTAVNNGDVEGNADFATGASNQGGTVGSSGQYVPPYTGAESSATNWTNCINAQWFNLTNWFNSNYSTNIPIYPLSSTNVVMSGNCAAVTVLSCNLWVKPASINTTLITDPSGIYFCSATGFVLSGINISGNATFGLNTTLI